MKKTFACTLFLLSMSAAVYAVPFDGAGPSGTMPPLQSQCQEQ
jgi:hypothetical protein